MPTIDLKKAIQDRRAALNLPEGNPTAEAKALVRATQVFLYEKFKHEMDVLSVVKWGPMKDFENTEETTSRQHLDHGEERLVFFTEVEHPEWLETVRAGAVIAGRAAREIQEMAGVPYTLTVTILRGALELVNVDEVRQNAVPHLDPSFKERVQEFVQDSGKVFFTYEYEAVKEDGEREVASATYSRAVVDPWEEEKAKMVVIPARNGVTVQLWVKVHLTVTVTLPWEH